MVAAARRGSRREVAQGRECAVVLGFLRVGLCAVCVYCDSAVCRAVAARGVRVGQFSRVHGFGTVCQQHVRVVRSFEILVGGRFARFLHVYRGNRGSGYRGGRGRGVSFRFAGAFLF